MVQSKYINAMTLNLCDMSSKILFILHYSLVESKHAETAGTIMAYFLAIGLGLGSASSFGITESI